jgi:hypothetical protein
VSALAAVRVRPGVLQRKCACGGEIVGGGECEACKRKRERVMQRAAVRNDSVGHAPPIVDNVLRQPGEPLSGRTRAAVEPRFGHDFSGVRVHTDVRAAASARAVGAAAYTVGRDIVFDSGRYAPGTTRGMQLLAHELTHVVQQSSSAPQNGGIVLGRTDDPAEAEADRVSKTFGASSVASAGPSLLRRQAATAAPTTPANASPFQRLGPPPTHTLGDFTNSGGGKFAAELDRRQAIASKGAHPCMLLINVRIKFVQSDPASWPPGRFAAWQAQAARAITDRWSFRYLLARSGSCPNDEPCVRTAVAVRMTPVTSGEHHTVNVKFNKPADARSDALNWFEPDVRRRGDDMRKRHATVRHEFGHLLGLDHVASSSKECGAARKAAKNPADEPDVCYGRDREERAGIMGAGEVVNPQDYQLFLQPMKLATSCDWRVEGTRGSVFGTPGWVTGAVAGGLLGLLGGALLGSLLGPLGMLGFGLAFALGGALIGGGIGGAVDE